MIRVLTPIAIPLFFMWYPPFHRLLSLKVVLVLKRLIYRVHHFRNVHFVKTLPNIGRPLFDCSREASSWITSQCSTRMLSLMRRMSAAIQFTGRPKSEKRPCTITKSPSATIVPGSYLSVVGRLLMRLNSHNDRARYERYVECSQETNSVRPLRSPVC